MLTLGIDPGTSCGWALLLDGKRIGSGAWDLRARRHEGGGMRYLRVRQHLVELLSAHPVQAVAYEEVRRHMGTDAAHVYGGIVAMVATVCEERGVPYMGVPVGTVKKRATTKGNASKDEMVAAAEAEWSITCETDDEADALWVAKTATDELST